MVCSKDKNDDKNDDKAGAVELISASAVEIMLKSMVAYQCGCKSCMEVAKAYGVMAVVMMSAAAAVKGENAMLDEFMKHTFEMTKKYPDLALRTTS